jgi:hypothetical protein
MWFFVIFIGITLIIAGSVLIDGNSNNAISPIITPTVTSTPAVLPSSQFHLCPVFRNFDLIGADSLYTTLVSNVSSPLGQWSLLQEKNATQSRLTLRKTVVESSNSVIFTVMSTVVINTMGLNENSIAFSADGTILAIGQPTRSYQGVDGGTLTIYSNIGGDVFTTTPEVFPSLYSGSNIQSGRVVRFSQELGSDRNVYISSKAQNGGTGGGAIYAYFPGAIFGTMVIQSPDGGPGDGFGDQFYVPNNSSFIVLQRQSSTVYIFENGGSDPTDFVVPLVTPAGYLPTINYGYDFWLSKDLKFLVVSAPNYGVGTNSKVGIIFVYNRLTTGSTQFTLIRELTCPDGIIENCQFGVRVTASPDEKFVFVGGMANASAAALPAKFGKIYTYEVDMIIHDFKSTTGSIEFSYGSEIATVPTGFGANFTVGHTGGFANNHGYQMFPIAAGANRGNSIIGCP